MAMITRLLRFLAIVLVFAPVCLDAQGVITIDIENVQKTRSLAAIRAVAANARGDASLEVLNSSARNLSCTQ